MEFLNRNPTTTAAWQELIKHAEETKNFDIKEAFKNNPERAKEFHIRWNDFFVDFSKNKINENTINLLQKLAKETELSKGIEAYFGGEKINKTEKREVLHTALRDFSGEKILVNGKNVMPEVTKAKNKIKAFSNAIIKGTKKGYTNKKFTDVVNIGIGGSDLGPAMVVESLMYYKNNLNVHFVSNVDGDHVQEILKKINPETTLFVIVSKTFTTQETLTNAETIRNWFLKSATQLDVAQHFVAVSTNSKKVTEFGIAAENIFPMWDWVGGRFSLWSAVGLSISLAVGFSNFEKLLKGAYEMDMHFKNTALEENIPVTLALLSIWYNNFLNAETEVLIPYSQYLQKLAPYLQQGIMESNGKSIDRNGKPVNYQTGTVIWGEPGTNSQHAFFQLIHQGTKLIPADFIGFKKSLHGNQDHHNKLMSNFFAQTEALLQGKTEAEVIEEFKAKGIAEEEYKALVPFKVFNGNKPTTTLLIDQLTPETLGSLIALYEHKIFVQGYIWNIFSYDQWGVELGKQLASSILTEIETKSVNKHDASTIQLLNEFLM
jgi:glucose-6-phosphate isomerase